MSRKKQLVIDSSVSVKWINSQDEKYLDKADQVLTATRDGKVELLAPELSKYEIGNVLWKKRMELPSALSSLTCYYSIPINFISWNPELAGKSMEIAIENEITYYDACFLALADKFNAPLLTDNPKHQNKKIAGIKIVPLSDFSFQQA